MNHVESHKKNRQSANNIYIKSRLGVMEQTLGSPRMEKSHNKVAEALNHFQ